MRPQSTAGTLADATLASGNEHNQIARSASFAGSASGDVNHESLFTSTNGMARWAATEVRMERDGSMATKRRVRMSRTADAVPPSVVAHRCVVRVQRVRSYLEYDGIRSSLPEIRNQNGVSLCCSWRNACPSIEVRVGSTSVVTT